MLLPFCGQVCGGRYIFPLCYSVIKIHMDLSCVVCCENIYLSSNVSPPRAHCIAEESKRQQLFKFTPDQINCRVLLAPCVVCCVCIAPSHPTSVHVLVIQCICSEGSSSSKPTKLFPVASSSDSSNSFISSPTFHSFLEHTCSLPLTKVNISTLSPITLHRATYQPTVAVFLLWLRACRFFPLQRCASYVVPSPSPDVVPSFSVIPPRSCLQKSKTKNRYKKGITTYILYDVEVAQHIWSLPEDFVAFLLFACLSFVFPSPLSLSLFVGSMLFAAMWTELWVLRTGKTHPTQLHWKMAVSIVILLRLVLHQQSSSSHLLFYMHVRDMFATLNSPLPLPYWLSHRLLLILFLLFFVFFHTHICIFGDCRPSPPARVLVFDLTNTPIEILTK